MKRGHSIFGDVGGVAFMNASSEAHVLRCYIERDKHSSRSTPLGHSTRDTASLSVHEEAIYLDHVKAALSQ